ncbi:DDE-type integrase/transposase/recombinase [Psychrobacter sp. HII-4]|uniref:DDE-type integrase/transposase/recombinase n=1 Tax=Psychrobacter sp. HII-4 TaxID=1569264 RepID=UPI0039B7421B
MSTRPRLISITFDNIFIIRFRTFNVIDDYNREVLGIDIGTSIPSLRVIRYLDQLAEWHGYPKQIRVDNGSEFTSSVFTDWASAQRVSQTLCNCL